MIIYSIYFNLISDLSSRG